MSTCRQVWMVNQCYGRNMWFQYCAFSSVIGLHHGSWQPCVWPCNKHVFGRPSNARNVGLLEYSNVALYTGLTTCTLSEITLSSPSCIHMHITYVYTYILYVLVVINQCYDLRSLTTLAWQISRVTADPSPKPNPSPKWICMNVQCNL